MPRDWSADMLAEARKLRIRPVQLIEVEFASGWVRGWTGRGTLNWNSVDWGGIGDFLETSEMKESRTIESNGVTLTLNGAAAIALQTAAMLEGRHGKPGRIYQGYFNEAGSALIASPSLAWSGQVDVITIDENPARPLIQVRLENRFIDMRSVVPRRYTHEDQQLESPGDLGFEFGNTLQKSTAPWVPPVDPGLGE